MPYTVRKRKGRKPWAIVNASTGRTVARSRSKRKARISASIRNRAHR